MSFLSGLGAEQRDVYADSSKVPSPLINSKHHIREQGKTKVKQKSLASDVKIQW